MKSKITDLTRFLDTDDSIMQAQQTIQSSEHINIYFELIMELLFKLLWFFDKINVDSITCISVFRSRTFRQPEKAQESTRKPKKSQDNYDFSIEIPKSKYTSFSVIGPLIGHH